MYKASEPFIIWYKKPWLIALLLSAMAFALFSPAIGYDFIDFDDNLYVYENVHVAHGLSWNGFAYAFRTSEGGVWMPVTWLSYFLDTSLYGTRPAGYHLTNILLHSASVALLFSVLQRMTKRMWAAVFVAALFACHPQRLESVAWVAERKDVLSVFFWMLGLLAYTRHAEQPGPRRMIWVGICLILGGLAKSMVVSFPLILLLLDFWPLRRFGNSTAEFRANAWKLIWEKIPLFIICALFALMALRSEHTKSSIEPGRVIENVWYYFQGFFVPTGLAIAHRVEPLDYRHVAAATFILVLISLLVLRRVWQWPWLAVGWFWFLFTLGPVVGIQIGAVTVADRYSYLPSVGLALMVVFSILEAAVCWHRIHSLAAGLSIAWVLFYALTTWVDLPWWHDTFTVFKNAYRNGGHYLACDQVASFLYARHDFQSSLVICNEGIKENPRLASLYNTRGGDYYMLGDLDKALADFDRAIQINPAFSATYYLRSLVHIQRKQFAEAREDTNNYVKYGGKLDITALNIPQESNQGANLAH